METPERTQIQEKTQEVFNKSAGPMQFVWFYIPAPDDGLELKLSMRSVRKNFIGEARFTVIGDKPKWYRGHHIPCQRTGRFRGERPDRLPFRDTCSKIVLAANHPEIEEDFIHIMDDVYLLRQTTKEELSTPRFDPWYRQNQKREWHRWIATTFAALRSNGYPTLQAGTHLPHLFEKTKLREMFVEFDMPKAMILFEICYSNRFREHHIPYNVDSFLTRLQRPETKQRLDAIGESSNVLNYVGSVFRKTMREWLQQRFAEPTESEG